MTKQAEWNERDLTNILEKVRLFKVIFELLTIRNDQGKKLYAKCAYLCSLAHRIGLISFARPNEVDNEHMDIVLDLFHALKNMNVKVFDNCVLFHSDVRERFEETYREHEIILAMKRILGCQRDLEWGHILPLYLIELVRTLRDEFIHMLRAIAEDGSERTTKMRVSIESIIFVLNALLLILNEGQDTSVQFLALDLRCRVTFAKQLFFAAVPFNIGVKVVDPHDRDEIM